MLIEMVLNHLRAAHQRIELAGGGEETYGAGLWWATFRGKSPIFGNAPNRTELEVVLGMVPLAYGMYDGFDQIAVGLIDQDKSVPGSGVISVWSEHVSASWKYVMSYAGVASLAMVKSPDWNPFHNLKKITKTIIDCCGQVGESRSPYDDPNVKTAILELQGQSDMTSEEFDAVIKHMLDDFETADKIAGVVSAVEEIAEHVTMSDGPTVDPKKMN